MNKRDFVKSAVALAGSAAVLPLAGGATVRPPASAAAPLTKAAAPEKYSTGNRMRISEAEDAAFRGEKNSSGTITLKKSLGYGMIYEKLSLTDKFKLVKDLGFDGIELNAPSEFSISELLEAKAASGIELPSVVNRDHWSSPLSDPDPAVRKKCIASVAQSLQEVKELGGDTVLVVPGVVNEKISYEEAYITSQNAIRELIPYAEKTGMQIGLENVWNNFLLSPVEAKRYLDEINHPLVGWYFDIGNILRYGWPEHWIRTLNRRIVKLHIKEFSRERMNTMGLREGFKVDLLKGDNNWPVVMKAIGEVNHTGGWLTAEVPGGDRTHLKTISAQMDRIISYGNS